MNGWIKYKSFRIFLLFIVAILLLLTGCSESSGMNNEKNNSSKHIQSAINIGSSSSAAVMDSRINSSSSPAKENSMYDISMGVNGLVFDIELEETETAEAFASSIPVNLTLQELNGNEKYVYLPESLPAKQSVIGKIEAGDVMLYGSNCLVVFYKSHASSYAYSRIGKIKNTSNLAEAFGQSDIEVSFIKKLGK